MHFSWIAIVSHWLGRLWDRCLKNYYRGFRYWLKPFAKASSKVKTVTLHYLQELCVPASCTCLQTEHNSFSERSLFQSSLICKAVVGRKRKASSAAELLLEIKKKKLSPLAFWPETECIKRSLELGGESIKQLESFTPLKGDEWPEATRPEVRNGRIDCCFKEGLGKMVTASSVRVTPLSHCQEEPVPPVGTCVSSIDLLKTFTHRIIFCWRSFHAKLV